MLTNRVVVVVYGQKTVKRQPPLSFTDLHSQVKSAAFREKFLLVGRKEQSRGLMNINDN